jgi:glycosyltransferase involved in cell wall biosynthesis
VAGDAARYFVGADAFAAALDALLAQPAALQTHRVAALARFESAFTWPAVLQAYETLLTQWLPGSAQAFSNTK